MGESWVRTRQCDRPGTEWSPSAAKLSQDGMRKGGGCQTEKSASDFNRGTLAAGTGQDGKRGKKRKEGGHKLSKNRSICFRGEESIDRSGVEELSAEDPSREERARKRSASNEKLCNLKV